MNIVRWSLFLAVVVVAYSAVSSAAPRGPTYGKADESATGGAGTAEGGDCTETADSTDQQAMDALRLRNLRRAEALEAKVAKIKRTFNECQAHRRNLDQSIAEAQRTVDEITRSQSGNPLLWELRSLITKLQEQKNTLSTCDNEAKQNELRGLEAEVSICHGRIEPPSLLPAVPFFTPGGPTINCRQILRERNDPQCRCFAENRPPVCSEEGVPTAEEERVYNFYWRIEFIKEGRLYRDDGTVGYQLHRSYDEAYTACVEHVKNIHDIQPLSLDITFTIVCTPQ